MEYRPLNLEELDAIEALESSSYPSDEAASREMLKYRLENCSEYFFGAFRSKELVGFVCGTLTNKPELDHESMTLHIPNGDYLCIHSVVVAPHCRRQKIAQNLLNEYKRRLKIKSILLIAKKNLIPLYEKCGFQITRPSPVVHGADPWFEMRFSY